MPKFSQKSLDKLHDCHPLLQMVMLAAIKKTDFSVICGFRGEKEQNEAYSSGNSNLKWPQSKHNKTPSEAVDIVPYPVDWNDIKRFETLGQIVLQTWETDVAEEDRVGWELVWGKNFKGLVDYPHFELRRTK
jgi:peptidoglycan L-alanyl-D-glutamate endopeptidase CwlK